MPKRALNRTHPYKHNIIIIWYKGDQHDPFVFSRLPNAQDNGADLLHKFTSEAQSLLIFLLKFILHNTLPISYDQNLCSAFIKRKKIVKHPLKKCFQLKLKESTSINSKLKIQLLYYKHTFIFFVLFLPHFYLMFLFLLTLFSPSYLSFSSMQNGVEVFHFPIHRNKTTYGLLFWEKGLELHFYGLSFLFTILSLVRFSWHWQLHHLPKRMLGVFGSLLDNSSTCLRYFLSK